MEDMDSETVIQKSTGVWIWCNGVVWDIGAAAAGCYW
jgi:hypothetical protein